MRPGRISLINHDMAHSHSSRAGTSNQKILVLVSLLDDFQKLGSSVCGTKPKLIATAKHHSVTIADALQKFLIGCILPRADMHHVYVGAADLSKCLKLALTHVASD